MTPASDSERPFRFFDNRERYLLFTTTTTEKQETAKRICQELTHLDPKPPAFRLFQAGAGEGTLLNLVLRHLHSGWPDTPVLAVVKEISPQFIRMAVRNLADRFREHPELVLVFTNLRYDEAPRLTPRDAGRLRWRDLALTGTTAHGFESQIQAEMVRLNEDWRFREDPGSGTWSYLEPAVLVVHRADQAFVLDRVIPRQDARALDYDLVIASQPYRAGLPAATKVRRVLAPLARALAPGGRMIAIQAKGGDPGLDIVQRLWPDARPFASPRGAVIEVLGQTLAAEHPDLSIPALSDEAAGFRYALRLNPYETESNIGTSSLHAAWNAAIYVAQIEDRKLAGPMQDGSHLDVTRDVLRSREGLWFNDECIVVARAGSR